MAELYRCWNRELRPALEKEGIVFVVPEALEPVQQDWLRDLFEREIFPVLTPIALDPAHPFPFVASGSLNIAALLETERPRGARPARRRAGAARAAAHPARARARGRRTATCSSRT